MLYINFEQIWPTGLRDMLVSFNRYKSMEEICALKSTQLQRQLANIAHIQTTPILVTRKSEAVLEK